MSYKVGAKLEHVRSGQVFTVQRVRNDYVDLQNDETGIGGPVKKLFADVNMRPYVSAKSVQAIQSDLPNAEQDALLPMNMNSRLGQLLMNALLLLERIASAGPGNTADQCKQVAVEGLKHVHKQAAELGVELVIETGATTVAWSSLNSEQVEKGVEQ